MKKLDQDIKTTMKSALDNDSPTQSFDTLWNLYTDAKKRHSRYKKASFIPMIAILSLLVFCTIGFAGITLSRLVDNTDLPFVDDPRVIGKWEVVDFVNIPDDFNPDHDTPKPGLYLNELVFVKGGKMLDKIEISNLCYSSSTWTKGYVVTEHLKIAAKYDIKVINGSSYMFVQWKSGDYIYRQQEPKYYVLKQVDQEDYSDYKVVKREDKIDYPFVNNPEMLGKWESVDFIEEIDAFRPNKLWFFDDLYLNDITILEDGNLAATIDKGKPATAHLSWTEDLIINHHEKTASKCTIKIIEDQTYMFFE